MRPWLGRQKEEDRQSDEYTVAGSQPQVAGKGKGGEELRKKEDEERK